jgi:NADP-dependent 3-hydroxy acid dehydrogenase YdfG
MKIDVSEKAAPVPESTERIGFASATTLAEAGAPFFLNGRDKTKIGAAARTLEGCFHSRVSAVPLFIEPRANGRLHRL